jgi:hypothetical protein
MRSYWSCFSEGKNRHSSLQGETDLGGCPPSQSDLGSLTRLLIIRFHPSPSAGVCERLAPLHCKTPPLAKPFSRMSKWRIALWGLLYIGLLVLIGAVKAYLK